MSVRGVYNFFSSVSLQQKFEVMDQCYCSVTAQFFLQAKEKISLRPEGRLTQKKRVAQFWLLFLMCFSPPTEPALYELG